MDRRASWDWIEIARIIVEARCEGISRHLALIDILDVDAGTARYLSREVRERGLLGFGEHRPARATVLRGTSRENHWMVCTRCTDHWPCALAQAHAETYVARMPAGGEGTTTNDDRPTPGRA